MPMKKMGFYFSSRWSTHTTTVKDVSKAYLPCRVCVLDCGSEQHIGENFHHQVAPNSPII